MSNPSPDSVTTPLSGTSTTRVNKRTAISPPSPTVAQLLKQQCTSPQTMSGDEHYSAAPPYFKAWIDDFAKREGIIVGRLDSISDQIQTKVSTIEKNVEAISRSMINVDSCEVRVTGVPASCATNLVEATSRLLHAIECATCVYHVLDVRLWSDKKSTAASNGNANQQSSLNAPSPTTITLVIKLASPVIRNTVVQSSKHLKNLNAKTIFGGGPESKVYINPIWPKPVYVLLAKARKAVVALSYNRATVLNVVVCVRATPTSE